MRTCLRYRLCARCLRVRVARSEGGRTLRHRLRRHPEIRTEASPHDRVERTQLIASERFHRNKELHPTVVELDLDRAGGRGVLERGGSTCFDRPDALPRHGVHHVRARTLHGQASRVDPQDKASYGYEVALARVRLAGSIRAATATGSRAPRFREFGLRDHSPADEDCASQLDLRVAPHSQ